MNKQSMLLAKMMKTATMPTKPWTSGSRAGRESFALLVSKAPPSTPLHARTMSRMYRQPPISKGSKARVDITWAGTLIASCESRTISYRSVLDNAPCRRLCSSRSHCRLRLENLWSKAYIIFIHRQDFWPNFSPHKKRCVELFFKEKQRHAPTYLGEVAFMQTGVTLCNVAIFLEVGSIISRIDSNGFPKHHVICIPAIYHRRHRHCPWKPKICFS